MWFAVDTSSVRDYDSVIIYEPFRSRGDLVREVHLRDVLEESLLGKLGDCLWEGDVRTQPYTSDKLNKRFKKPVVFFVLFKVGLILISGVCGWGEMVCLCCRFSAGMAKPKCRSWRRS